MPGKAAPSTEPLEEVEVMLALPPSQLQDNHNSREALQVPF